MNESAGVSKSARTRQGNANLKRILGVAAMTAIRQKDSYLSAFYRRIAARRGRHQAQFAVMRKIAVAIWHILKHKTGYQELGADYFARRDPERAMRRMIKEANRLGLTVRFEPARAAHRCSRVRVARSLKELHRNRRPRVGFGGSGGGGCHKVGNPCQTVLSTRSRWEDVSRGGSVAPRLVFVHGIGGPRRVEEDRERWIDALAAGARRAGHGEAARGLIDGSLAEVVFAYYGDLFQRPQAQGAGGINLDEDEAVLLNRLFTEIVQAHVQAHDEDPNGLIDATVERALAQLCPQGEAQGAGELVRRVINAGTTLLGSGPWGRAGQWAGGKLLIRDFAQVARYLARREQDGEGDPLDARIRAVVADALGSGPTVVVAHSLGSVVSFETLCGHETSVPLLVTLGSPLAMRAVVWPKVRPAPPTTPGCVGQWLNYWDRDDIIVPRPVLEEDVRANAAGVVPSSSRVDSDGVWVHTATKYLAKADVAGPVMEALQGLTAVP
ncbi:hypothetical protein E1285_16225 [Actinomadura sp. 7K507]|nr:hypothetical protein E1285_16225 [Actinomadura sp. 7K507]